MKKLFLKLTFLLIFYQSEAQSPDAISYQAIIRNTEGEILANKNIFLRMSIHDSIPTGQILYREVHSIQSNAQGLVNMLIGKGNTLNGKFSNIKWGINQKYIQTEIKISDSTNGCDPADPNCTFVDIGTSQLVSVPYALYAENSKNGLPANAKPGEIMFYNGSQWVALPPGKRGQSLVFCDGGPKWGNCDVQTVRDIDGNQYNAVTICENVWTAKNLTVTKYRNGDEIPQITDLETWKNLRSGAWCWYKNDSATYAATYGKLYNWYAVNDPRGLAPDGFHIPSKEEFASLVKCLGGNYSAGSDLKSAPELWDYTSADFIGNYDATNNSGFAALPGGYLETYDKRGFESINVNGYWWSSTVSSVTFENYSFAYILNLNASDSFARINQSNMIYGYSVRCVKD